MIRRIAFTCILLATATTPARAGVVNPDISIVGQPFIRWTDEPSDPAHKRPTLNLGEVEGVFDAYLNPYAHGTFILSIADGEYQIAHFECVRIAELDRGELLPLGIEAEHGEIGLLVLEDDLGRKLPSVGKRHGDLSLAAPLDDVVVGDHDPVGAGEHAGAERVLDALLGNTEALAEQAPEERVVDEG